MSCAKALLAGDREVVALDAGTGQPRLDAAGSTAKARRPGTLVVARPRQRVVTPFARDRIRSVEHLAPHDDTGADAGADDDAEDDRCARRGPVRRLGQRKAVGIVGDANLAPERRLEIAPDRLPVEAHRIRAAQQARGARDRSGRADADRPSHAEVVLGRGDKAGERLDRRTIIVPRRRHPPPQELTAVPVERNDLDLGAAEIDAEPQMRVIHAARPVRGGRCARLFFRHISCMSQGKAARNARCTR